MMGSAAWYPPTWSGFVDLAVSGIPVVGIFCSEPVGLLNETTCLKCCEEKNKLGRKKNFKIGIAVYIGKGYGKI